MVDYIIRRCRGVPVNQKKCEICKKNTGLLRCSRCKNIWYCCVKHQQKHWFKHQRFCKPYKKPPLLPKLNYKNADDEIQLGETRISLRCPLSIKRIMVPVRGLHCNHPQCFDLRSFFGFCSRTYLWRCPVCSKSVKFENLYIDEEMQKVLDDTDDKISQVCLYPDGRYKLINTNGIIQNEKQFDSKPKRVKSTKEFNFSVFKQIKKDSKKLIILE